MLSRLRSFFIPIATAETTDYISNLDDVNPVKGDLISIIGRITAFLVNFAAIVAPIIIIWGAFQILTAGGQAEKVKKGKQAILYAVIGFLIIILAKGIVAVIKSALDIK